MSSIENAVQTGKCAIAISGALLRDAGVMLALTQREALPSMALSGPAVHPVQPVGEAALTRAIASPGGVVVLVEPDSADEPAVQQIAEIVQRARHKPTVVVLSRSYNPLWYAMAFRGVKIENVKDRGKRFLERLPMPPSLEDAPVPEIPKTPAQKAASGEGARFCFVGREDEVEALKGHLGTGGPIVVSGPNGVGRTLVIEHALEAAGLKVLPELRLGHDSGFDTFVARLAELTKAAGVQTLVEALGQPHTPAQVVDAAIAALQAASGTEGQAMVVHRTELGLGRAGDMFRKGRLELLLQALLTSTYPLRLVFVSQVQPVFFREGRAQHLRRLEVGGLKGRFYHEIFDAYRAPEFPREKFGPLSEKLHGHALAVRTYAVAVRDQGVELLDDAKFLAAESLDDTKRLEKALQKRIEKLPKDLRATLAAIATLSYPVDGGFLSDFNVSRKQRQALLSAGLLDVVGTVENKRYAVHPTVARQLTLREITDFDTMKDLGERYSRISRSSEGPDRLWTSQEANRFFVASRQLRSRLTVPYPDHDPLVESCHGMLRGNQPRPDLALQRCNEILAKDPSNAEAHLMRVEAMFGANVDAGEIATAFDEAMEKAPVPEVFHQAVRFWLGRRSKNKAIAALEAGVAALPDESRLKTRLASMLLRAGRRNEAVDLLKAAMEADPMLPDAYGLLGNARRDEGAEALAEAEELLREAVRLAPEDGVQLARLGHLLVDRARVQPEDGERLLEEAKQLLDNAIRVDKRNAEAHLLLAQVVRLKDGDVERATWLLDRAKKETERGSDRLDRIRLERALLALQKGDLDDAEKRCRELIARDPSNYKVFVALAQVLEARQLWIPAHAELLRAKERCHASSLAFQEVEGELVRLQALIEAQAAGLLHAAAPAAEADEALTPMGSEHRVIRRRKHDAEPEAHPEAVEAHPDAVEAHPDAVEAHTEAVEGHAGDVEAHPPVEPAAE